MNAIDKRKEEWTRRKSYLLRSLFEDEPMLSTISEEDESVAEYSPIAQSRNYAARNLEALDRPSSPLPNLIIEIVPRRPRIYDDEPEEYYKRLQKQMIKLYRRDYLSRFSSISSDNSELEIPSDHELHPSSNEDDYCAPEDSNLDVEKSINDTEDCVVQGESPVADKSSADKSTTSSSFDSTNKLETAAEEEQMEATINSKSKESTTSSAESSSENNTEVKEFSIEDEFEDEENHESVEQAGQNDASLINESILTIPEPDEMRRNETRLSLFSITSQEFEKSPEKLVLYQGKQLVFMEDSTERDTNVTTHLRDITEQVTSTPNSLREVNRSRLSKRKSFSDRFEPYSSSRDSFLQTCNRGIQTSFSEEESDNQSLWRNFFTGTPIFFRLQS